jgi:hypothetical protein
MTGWRTSDDDDDSPPEGLVIGDTTTLRTMGDRLRQIGRRAFPSGWRHAVKQVLILFSAFVVYDMIRIAARGREVVAIAHSERVIRLERFLHVFWEPWMQARAVRHHDVIEFLSWFYVEVHLPALVATFIWIYIWHHRSWALYRNAFLLMNAIGLAVFASLPVAPPRLVPASGMIDTKYLLSGQGVHSGALAFVTNPYAAMPSLHLGYALFTSVALWTLARGIVARVLAVVYSMIVLIAIVTTGNHYLLDGLAGGATLALAFLLARAIAARAAPRTADKTDADESGEEAAWD